MNLDEQTYRENYQLVYIYCLRVLGNATDAEDVAHDTFVTFCQKPVVLSNPRYWLIKTAAFKCLALIRKRIRRAEAFSADLCNIGEDSTKSDIVEHLQTKLKPDEFQAIMKVSDAVSIKDLARERGLTYEAGRALVRRARKRAIFHLATVGVIGAVLFFGNSLYQQSVLAKHTETLARFRFVPEYQSKDAPGANYAMYNAMVARELSEPEFDYCLDVQTFEYEAVLVIAEEMNRTFPMYPERDFQLITSRGHSFGPKGAEFAIAWAPEIHKDDTAVRAALNYFKGKKLPIPSRAPMPNIELDSPNPP